MAGAQTKLTTRLIRVVLYVASILVLAVSISLYFLPGRTDVYFSWTVNPPLTAAVLGAGYLASFILEFVSARERVWANARAAVPAVWVFTFLTLIITLVHFDRFHFGAPQLITVLGTWFWLLVYTSVPVVMGIAWFLQARSPGTDPPRRSPLPAGLRVILVIQGLMMLIVGVFMLIAPQAIIPYWPWTLSVLTCRAIGAWAIGIGIIAVEASWENEWRRLWPMMISYMVYGFLQLLNLLRFWGEPDWTLLSAWTYALFALSLFLVGIYGVAHIRRSHLPAAPEKS